jgi:purine-cytosine permease-like protein
LGGNLGVSLLGFTGALSSLTPFGVGPLSLPAAVTAIVVGSALGGLIMCASLVLGAKTGARPWCCCAACSARRPRSCPPC